MVAGMRLLFAVMLVVGCKDETPPQPSPTPELAKPVDPYADVRDRMVRDTIEARGIRDTHVLAAMRKVPRQEFVPPEMRVHAYEDRALPIGFGLTISQPYIVAMMTEAAHVRPENRVLEIGTGSGYQAAVLAALGCSVYTIEINEALAKRTDLVLRNLGLHTIQNRTGDGYDGAAEAAPFDAIVVTAAVPAIPVPLLDQLKPGRMVIPVDKGDTQILEVVTRDKAGIHEEELLEVLFGPMLGKVRRDR
jgi:protein-L-isoaspartate(D-aspartate) O-methyltransferase